MKKTIHYCDLCGKNTEIIYNVEEMDIGETCFKKIGYLFNPDMLILKKEKGQVFTVHNI